MAESLNLFTGGDAGIQQFLARLWTEQGGNLCSQIGMDPKVTECLGKVSQAASTP